jgi:hypothetical protein
MNLLDKCDEISGNEILIEWTGPEATRVLKQDNKN